ncbi:hypothetical protein SPLC1_S370720 [Arthrospira platensis C1]|uniref:Uncharacterized protein n=1 Tax=Limnospira indica PCC 8005 TaxID=376219 RepID=A0A9P1NZP8_9CYAN|nr:hypothetical protein SPLC1_S370720 [Arthrospira platensis C1]CDM96526.1 hypothetical protein ARTHRO_40935 [Limnospira indica PCC 8005]
MVNQVNWLCKQELCDLGIESPFDNYSYLGLLSQLHRDYTGGGVNFDMKFN